MIINGTDIKDTGCSVQKKLIRQAESENEGQFHNGNFIGFVVNDGIKLVDVEFKVRGIDREEVIFNLSALASLIGINEFYFKNLPNMYFIGMTDGDPEITETGFDDILLCKYSWKCFMYGIEKTISLEKKTSQTIFIEGNGDTPCIIEITPTTTIIDFMINDIKIHNAEIGKKIIIDSMQNIITVNGINKFKDVELDDFPVLRAGTNEININNINCDISIRYRPRYK